MNTGRAVKTTKTGSVSKKIKIMSVARGGGLKKAPLAAWEAATRRAQLGSRGSRPGASWGGIERVFGGRSGACRFAWKKVVTDFCWLRCVRACV